MTYVNIDFTWQDNNIDLVGNGSFPADGDILEIVAERAGLIGSKEANSRYLASMNI